MRSPRSLPGIYTILIAAAVLGTAGCQPDGVQGDRRPIVQPLGAMSDCVWAHQEANAEHSDFVVYENEFGIDSEILNTAGEDHVRQIAARLASGQDCAGAGGAEHEFGPARHHLPLPHPPQSRPGSAAA